MVHCSGGAQTKILNSVKNIHFVKDTLSPFPPLFRLIQEQSGTSWKEMYKVFNMGHRMEIYIDRQLAPEVIALSENFGIPARIIGRCLPNEHGGNVLTIRSEVGRFIYYKD